MVSGSGNVVFLYYSYFYLLDASTGSYFINILSLLGDNVFCGIDYNYIDNTPFSEV